MQLQASDVENVILGLDAEARTAAELEGDEDGQ